MNRKTSIPSITVSAPKRSIGGPSTSKLPVKSGAPRTPSTGFRTPVPGPRRSRSFVRSNSTLSHQVNSRRSASQTPSNLRVPGSEGGRLKSSERKSKKVDVRPITNTAWQASQTAKVETFLKDIGAEKYLNHGKKLRPLTLNNFVQIINILLARLIDKIPQLNTLTYVEELPMILNMFSYPGTISKSSLKTVYTLHAWPSTLALLSWLVGMIEELIDLEDTDYFELEQSDVENNKGDYINKFKCNISRDGYCSFNNNEPLDGLTNFYRDEIAKLYDIPSDFYNQLKERRESYSITIKKLSTTAQEEDKAFKLEQNDIFQIREIAENERAFICDMEAKIKKCQIEKDDTIKEAETMAKKLESLEEESKRLYKEFGKIPTKNDLIELTNKIEEKINTKMGLEENLEKNQELSDNLDVKLTSIKANLSEKIKKHNSKLYEYSLKYPELEQILLSEKSGINAIDVKTLNEVFQKRKEIHEKLEEHSSNLKKEIQVITEELSKAENKLIVEKQELQKMKKIRSSKQQEFEKLEQYYVKEQEKFFIDISNLQTMFEEKKHTFMMKEEESKKTKIEIQQEEENSVQSHNDYIAHVEKLLQFFQGIKAKYYKSVAQMNVNLQGYEDTVQNDIRSVNKKDLQIKL